MNSVDIIGMLREVVDDYCRYFEYELPFAQEPDYGPNRIILKFWTKQAKSRLIVLPENSRVAIHGHLDVDKKFGTILLVEQLEVLH